MTYEEFLKGVDELGFKVGNQFENLRKHIHKSRDFRGLKMITKRMAIKI